MKTLSIRLNKLHAFILSAYKAGIDDYKANHRVLQPFISANTLQFVEGI
jgi:hypothetical protein